MSDMRAVRLLETGGPEKLRIETIAVPQPDERETLVRIKAAAFNRRDVFITQGLYPNITLPKTLGSDGAGTARNGDDVVVNPMLDWGDDPHAWSEHASILGMPHEGTFADYVAVPKENVYPKPPHLSYEEAAALPLAGLTAYRALFTRGGLRAGETLLIPGVGGGVQTFVLLFAKAAGARIIATSGNDEKLARAKALGADVCINYSQTPDWHKAIKRGEVDIVVDSSGGDTLNKSLGVIRTGGRIVIYGGTRLESTVRVFPIFWNHLDILGTSMGSPADFEALLAFVNEKAIVPVVDRVFPMEEALAAATRMASAQQFGKIVLRID
jgi:zinc-binding alcohol dehydrogenase/oxidoreductase